jgi:hypothetical protein
MGATAAVASSALQRRRDAWHARGMGDPEPGGVGGICDARGIAIEPPIHRVARIGRIGRIVPSISGRRHRRLTGLSGSLLFACMFLPAIEGCREPVMPYEVPAILPPYLYGLVFALIAMSPTRRAIQLGYAALRVLGALVVVGSVVLIVVLPPVGITELIIGTLLVLPATATSKEARVAMNGIEVGVVCVLWFGFLATFDDALIGVPLSLASSIGLLAGCIAWRHELGCRPAIDMPRAVAAMRHRA